ncbi:hypothetical protein [Allofustis seminis]|uniref:hypothetical protein n=1 Tax=Allofustis seminis TaxID=166939 RepID=UPI00036E50D2|nr:hypothetical protein [Allofustis seminis]
MARMKRLKEIHESLVEITEDLATLLYSDGQEVTEKTEKKVSIEIEEVRHTLANKSRAGFTEDIKALLKKYGSDKLSQVDPKDYESLLKDVEALK